MRQHPLPPTTASTSSPLRFANRARCAGHDRGCAAAASGKHGARANLPRICPRSPRPIRCWCGSGSTPSARKGSRRRRRRGIGRLRQRRYRQSHPCRCAQRRNKPFTSTPADSSCRTSRFAAGSNSDRARRTNQRSRPHFLFVQRDGKLSSPSEKRPSSASAGSAATSSTSRTAPSSRSIESGARSDMSSAASTIRRPTPCSRTCRSLPPSLR